MNGPFRAGGPGIRYPGLRYTPPWADGSGLSCRIHRVNCHLPVAQADDVSSALLAAPFVFGALDVNVASHFNTVVLAQIVIDKGGCVTASNAIGITLTDKARIFGPDAHAHAAVRPSNSPSEMPI